MGRVQVRRVYPAAPPWDSAAPLPGLVPGKLDSRSGPSFLFLSLLFFFSLISFLSLLFFFLLFLLFLLSFFFLFLRSLSLFLPFNTDFSCRGSFQLTGSCQCKSYEHGCNHGSTFEACKGNFRWKIITASLNRVGFRSSCPFGPPRAVQPLQCSGLEGQGMHQIVKITPRD